ncbi:MAG: hypothetical protein ACM3NT_05435 [Methylocystaceae bacterium]
MSKIVEVPIQVMADKNGKPLRIWHQGKRFEIGKITEYWHDTGEWWAGEEPKMFYRLLSSDQSLWEVYQNLITNEWYLYKVYD